MDTGPPPGGFRDTTMDAAAMKQQLQERLLQAKREEEQCRRALQELDCLVRSRGANDSVSLQPASQAPSQPIQPAMRTDGPMTGHSAAATEWRRPPMPQQSRDSQYSQYSQYPVPDPSQASHFVGSHPNQVPVSRLQYALPATQMIPYGSHPSHRAVPNPHQNHRPPRADPRLSQQDPWTSITWPPTAHTSVHRALAPTHGMHEPHRSQIAAGHHQHPPNPVQPSQPYASHPRTPGAPQRPLDHNAANQRVSTPQTSHHSTNTAPASIDQRQLNPRGSTSREDMYSPSSSSVMLNSYSQRARSNTLTATTSSNSNLTVHVKPGTEAGQSTTPSSLPTLPFSMAVETSTALERSVQQHSLPNPKKVSTTASNYTQPLPIVDPTPEQLAVLTKMFPLESLERLVNGPRGVQHPFGSPPVFFAIKHHGNDMVSVLKYRDLQLKEIQWIIPDYPKYVMTTLPDSRSSSQFHQGPSRSLPQDTGANTIVNAINQAFDSRSKSDLNRTGPKPSHVATSSTINSPAALVSVELSHNTGPNAPQHNPVPHLQPSQYQPNASANNIITIPERHAYPTHSVQYLPPHVVSQNTLARTVTPVMDPKQADRTRLARDILRVLGLPPRLQIAHFEGSASKFVVPGQSSTHTSGSSSDLPVASVPTLDPAEPLETITDVIVSGSKAPTAAVDITSLPPGMITTPLEPVAGNVVEEAEPLRPYLDDPPSTKSIPEPDVAMESTSSIAAIPPQVQQHQEDQKSELMELGAVGIHAHQPGATLGRQIHPQIEQQQAPSKDSDIEQLNVLNLTDITHTLPVAAALANGTQESQARNHPSSSSTQAPSSHRSLSRPVDMSPNPSPETAIHIDPISSAVSSPMNGQLPTPLTDPLPLRPPSTGHAPKTLPQRYQAETNIPGSTIPSKLPLHPSPIDHTSMDRIQRNPAVVKAPSSPVAPPPAYCVSPPITNAHKTKLPLFLPSPSPSDPPITIPSRPKFKDYPSTSASLADQSDDQQPLVPYASSRDDSLTPQTSRKRKRDNRMNQDWYIQVPAAPEWVKRFKQREKKREEVTRRKTPMGRLQVSNKQEVCLRGWTPMEQGASDTSAAADKQKLLSYSTSSFFVKDCKWKGCEARLNSTDNLIRHLGHHVLEQRQGPPWICLWASCNHQFADRSKLLFELEGHALPPLPCPQKDCEETCRSAGTLYRHFSATHDELRPRQSTAPRPRRHLAPPDRALGPGKHLPLELPGYLVQSPQVGIPQIGSPRHESLGAWVLRNIISAQPGVALRKVDIDGNATVPDDHEYRFLGQPRLITSFHSRPSKFAPSVLALPALGLDELFDNGRTFTLWPPSYSDESDYDADVEIIDSEGKDRFAIDTGMREESRGDGEEMEVEGLLMASI